MKLTENPNFRNPNSPSINELNEQARMQELSRLLHTAKNRKCTNCEGIYYQQVSVLRVISRLVAATPEDIPAFLPVMICANCGKPSELHMNMVFNNVEEDASNQPNEDEVGGK